MTAAQAESQSFLVAAFYAFTSLSPAELESLLIELPQLASREQVVGSVLLAPEGVNGTISGPDQGVTAPLDFAAPALGHTRVRRGCKLCCVELPPIVCGPS